MKLTRKILEAIDFDAVDKLLSVNKKKQQEVEKLRKKYLSKEELNLKPWELDDDKIKKIYGQSAKEILRIKASQPKQDTKSIKTKSSKMDDIDFIANSILGANKPKRMNDKATIESSKTKVTIDTKKKEIYIEKAYDEDRVFLINTAKNLGYKIKG